MASVKVIDCKQTDHHYLHKDFHGALCYAIKYLDDNFGQQATEEYLEQVGKTYFKPLSEKLKKEGLKVLEDHWRKIFATEGGQYRLFYQDQTLVLEVHQCPAIHHLQQRHLFFTDRYCQATVVVNNTICQAAGYKCACQYQPGKGKCIQTFWKE